MYAVLHAWYAGSPATAWGLYLRAVAAFEGSIGVRDMARNIRRPLFQDYTWAGRAIGLGLRLFRILLGIILYAVLAIAYAVGYIAWIAFPVVCVVSLVGSVMGQS